MVAMTTNMPYKEDPDIHTDTQTDRQTETWQCGWSSWPCLTVTNDQLALSTADRYKTVDGFDACLHWLLDRDAWNNAWSLHTDTSSLGLDWTLQCTHIVQHHSVTDDDIARLRYVFNTLRSINKWNYADEHG